MTPSTSATLATVIAAGLLGYFAGPGIAVLACIVGTVTVVVLACREEDRKARDARRKVLREAAWRDMGRP